MVCATPGSAPQLPITLTHSVATEAQLQLELASRQSDLRTRVMKVILVPAKGPIAVAEITAERLSHEHQQRNNGVTLYSVTVTMAKPPPDQYRVLLEDRDLAAPANCPLEFFEDLGSINV